MAGKARELKEDEAGKPTRRVEDAAADRMNENGGSHSYHFFLIESPIIKLQRGLLPQQ